MPERHELKILNSEEEFTTTHGVFVGSGRLPESTGDKSIYGIYRTGDSMEPLVIFRGGYTSTPVELDEDGKAIKIKRKK